MMDWKKLLCDEQFSFDDIEKKTTKDGRSQFQKDFDRIVFSPAFRRLQDKTQVFPLPESDFVHTRLTHSLEVAVVGRSLGNLVGEVILDRHNDLKNNFSKFHFGEIVAAACLAHDIGNPPFGHSGEDAISEYFRNGNGRNLIEKISDQKIKNDLENFEGNAQGFRIITKLQNPKVSGGLRLTLATLGALSKYPRESLLKDNSSFTKTNVYKKFGFFQSEKDYFKKIAEKTGLQKISAEDYFWCRHPLAFLVEGADDICYRIMDFEDGFRLGFIDFKEAEELLIPLIKTDLPDNYNLRDEADRIGFLRAKAINNLIRELAEIYLDNEEKIINGQFTDELYSLSPSSKYLNEIEELSIKKIYRHKVVTERECAGYEVLAGLLDVFINALNSWLDAENKNKSRIIISLLPNQITSSVNKDTPLSERLHLIIDFVSGMTDSYAVSLFRKIKGISLPIDKITT
ncbi:MAG: deoxyguanosinetriphosphate triphosphohydrolase [Ignavibacterium sp.]|nr:deoxyguanosinetriphosphate triphosphohydrolase [Ignavibacterium sp.]MDW8374448.1 deoxyguanosinetriphosphate triphosphohydrolase [Ignavibacteriales bacterium]